MSTSETRPLAVVTGASSGIGLELAIHLAAAGFDLVVNAEDAELEQAVAGLRAGSEGSVQAVRADLATTTGVEELHDAIVADGRPVAALCLNAGIGSGGHFVETPLERELRLVDLNVRSVVQLSKLVIRDMVARGGGRVLLTSSIAATMPGSYQAVYNASKSFVQSFGLALREELKDTGVTVTLLMPGPTETEFFERADMEDTRVGASESKDDPADVARMGFEAMMRGDERVVAASTSTKLQGRAGRFVPDKAKAKMHARMAEPGGAKDD